MRASSATAARSRRRSTTPPAPWNWWRRRARSPPSSGRYEPAPEERPDRFDKASLAPLAKTAQSVALAKDLKKRGWKFFGPTTAYAFMQSVGIVNDHLESCCCRHEVEQQRAAFDRPV